MVELFMWTRNWSIWKLYNDIYQGRIKQLQKWEDILLIKLAIEEFRTLRFSEDWGKISFLNGTTGLIKKLINAELKKKNFCCFDDSNQRFFFKFFIK